MKVEIIGKLKLGVIVKDIILVVIGVIGIVGGIGYVIEYCGEVICDLLMEGCMIVCNMVIEGGVCVGLIVLDEIIFEYVKGCLYVLKGVVWDVVLVYWKILFIDEGVYFDKVVIFKGEEIELVVIWGILFEDVLFILVVVFVFELFEGGKVDVVCCLIEYMGLIVG